MAISDPALAVESPLLHSELPAAEALVTSVGWNQIAADWQAFLDMGTVYAVRTSERHVVATAAMLPYGDRFGWISMVIVAQEFRRHGLARRLLERCIHELTAAGLVAILDATPAGRTVYRGLGFKDTWTFQRLVSRNARPRLESQDTTDGVMIAPITDATWPALCNYDAAAFGADRGELLERLRARCPNSAMFAERGGKLAGFILARDGRTATHVGPLIADDDTVALALLTHALATIDGPVYFDLSDVKTRIRTALDAVGFTSERPFTRMVHDRQQGFDDPMRTYAVVGPEFG